MIYMIFHQGQVFYTNWFSIENHYQPGMVVADLCKHKYYRGTTEGWIDIEEDHL